jgi:glycosyltransferase involved in cell wall biosynthesis
MFEVVTMSDGLLAISESTKKDIIRLCSELSVNTPEVTVIRLGDNIPVSTVPKKPDNIANNPFVLCVGTVEARKNHTLLYYAWKEGLRCGFSMPNLIVVGRQGWYTNDIIHAITNDPQTRDIISITNNISDDELVWLYQNCLFTVYPSYYEGWGLPVAESLAMGKVCLTTSSSSMPEIVEGLVETYSPFDTAQLAKMVQKYTDSKTRKKIEEIIKKEYKVATWRDCFIELCEFINFHKHNLLMVDINEENTPTSTKQ